ncbi:MAG TPA: outer membrane protein assembly factor BamA [Bryobacteraceae bacterium]|nr:outer membrane protein assembly factor BamA [Bryobacteraceae bacterium]
MKCYRRAGLSIVLLCLCALAPAARAQNPPASPPPAQQQPAPKPPEKPNPQNPFETVPEAPKQEQPQQPKLEAPKPTPEAPKVQAGGKVIEAIDFRGQRRVPQETLRALISTKKGDIYNEDDLHRDFMSLWNSGRFDDITLETEAGPNGGVILTWVVTERRVVRSIKYEGIKSLTVSEILDRFKERKVGLSVESQYDPNKVQHAAVVIKEYLAERGRQFATVDPEVRQIPPSSLEVVFNVNEGPKVQVGKITVSGNHALSQREVIRAMKNLHPYGIPHSILFENLFARTYDSSKLDEDKEHIRDEYQQRGYFLAKVLDQSTQLVDTGGHGFRIPLIAMHNPGKAVNIQIPVEEGRQYRLNKINFEGVKLFRTPETLMRPLFGMTEGDVFSTGKLRKGLENMRKLYGEFGYIDFVPEPSFDVIPNTNKIDLTLTADEGKQFFVRRIDFSGNVTTRDKVIRREILLDEGDIFNNRLWELSILRLNQLGYFEQLKAEEAADIKRNTQTNTVDITLKVRERGKNTIGLNGGVSEIAGSFVGLNYATNNFLGLGETLSINSQLGTALRSVSFGFTEPYFLDRPLQVGFEAHLTRYDFNQGRQESILAGENLIPLFNALGTQNLLNYIQSGHGFSVSASYPLKRSFSRLGITYGYDISNITVETQAAQSYFNYINFSGIAGPNSLSGIRTSRIVPSFSYNTVNHPITPTGGKSLFISTSFAGSVLGGNVNTIEPVIEGKYFHPAPWNKKHILAFHVLGSMITGYGGKEIPPFSRTYIGGEQDIRGFQIWGISPIAFVPSEATINVLNNDGSQRTQLIKNSSGVLVPTNVTMNIPIYQLAFPGGDAHAVANFEYRIPIFGPVILAPFVDAGVNRILKPGQLTMDPSRIGYLNNSYPTAGFVGKALIYPGTQAPRMSTGIELQVLLPVVQAPFRVYWAYNPLVVREFLQPPIVADRSVFPNQATFLNAVASFGQAYPFYEQRSMFRFTIGRTF